MHHSTTLIKYNYSFYCYCLGIIGSVASLSDSWNRMYCQKLASTNVSTPQILLSFINFWISRLSQNLWVMSWWVCPSLFTVYNFENWKEKLTLLGKLNQTLAGSSLRTVGNMAREHVFQNAKVLHKYLVCYYFYFTCENNRNIFEAGCGNAINLTNTPFSLTKHI